MKRLTKVQDRLMIHILREGGRISPWTQKKYSPPPDPVYFFRYGADSHTLRLQTVNALEALGLVEVKDIGRMGWGRTGYTIKLTDKGWAYATGEEYYPGPGGWG